jgi:tetratricopeptide (TPR) repeat protein
VPSSFRLCMIYFCLLPAEALAQVAPRQPIEAVAAQALFEEGRRLLQAGYVAEACPKLAESQRLEPAAGTLLNLALCHEQEGKTATAWLEYNDALALAARANDDERRQIARERIDALQPLLSRLVLLAPEQAPADLSVELDGTRLGSDAWATGVPVDPGKHTLRITARGKVPAIVPVNVGRAAGNLALPLPELADAPPPVAVLPQTQVSDADRTDAHVRWALEGAAFGVGGLALASTVYFGVVAKNEWDERNRHCRSGCDELAEVAGRNAERAALLSTISAATAAVGLGVGTYLMLTSGSTEDEEAVRLHVSGDPVSGAAALTAAGRF